jgi:predicted phosphodiesterase
MTIKLHVMSDLHLEFHDRYDPYLPGLVHDADVAILAGDIHSDERGVEWARQHFKIPTIIIPGNHEYYKHDFDEVAEKFDNPKNGSVIAARRHVVYIKNARFLCCTLWTGFDLYADNYGKGSQAHVDSVREAMAIANRGMNDYMLIRRGMSKFVAQDSASEYHKDVEFLETELKQVHADGPTIIVTHHLPIPECIDPIYAGNKLNPAFASDLRWMIDKYDPACWIYGHTHSSADFFYNNTRLVCNPRGYYPRDLNPKFNPRLVVEI